MNLTVADLLTLLFCSGVYDFALHNIRVSASSRDILCKILAGNAIVWPLFGWWQLFQVFQIAYGRRIIAREFFLSWSRYPCMRPWTVEHQPSKVRSCMPFYHSNNPFFHFNFVWLYFYFRWAEAGCKGKCSFELRVYERDNNCQFASKQKKTKMAAILETGVYAAQSTNYREVLLQKRCCKANTCDTGRHIMTPKIEHWGTRRTWVRTQFSRSCVLNITYMVKNLICIAFIQRRTQTIKREPILLRREQWRKKLKNVFLSWL